MTEQPVIPPGLIERLRSARSVMVLTGAGISAESGVPTFRDSQQGVWADFRPEEIATPEAFRDHPQRVWDWYASRRERVASTEPNAGHQALVEIEERVPHFTLATQNVDGLHHRAGSQRLIELHGNLLRTRCSVEDRLVPVWAETGEKPPRCPDCGGMLRPDVVWFGEPLPEDAIASARASVRACDLFLSVGTSAVVYPAAGLIDEALGVRACLVEVNPARTLYTDLAKFVLPGPAGVWLPALVRATWP